jgi:NAD(P)H dehydrogenase (quinone)
MSLLKKTGKALADVIPGLGKFTFDPSLGSIFVTSGTGVIGYRVALSLLEAGHKSVRVGIWKGDRLIGGDQSLGQKVADLLEAKGAKVVDFDWSNEDDYEMALEGVNTVFCTLPHMQGWADVFPAFLRKCKDKKVEHFIKVSFLRKGEVGERYRQNVPFVNFHGTCDDILQQAKNDSRISYTIICTSHLMSTPLLHQGDLLREQHKFITASYGMGVNYVSPNDVADAAMVVLLDRKKHRNTIYQITGPGPTTDADVARLLTEHYATPIEHIELGYHDYKKDVVERGLPDWLVRDSAAFEKMKASGVDELASSYTDDLKKLTGKKPETFKDYLTNKECMRPGLKFP